MIILLLGVFFMVNDQKELLEKILRELQDIRVIVQENSDAIDYIMAKESK